MYLEMRLVTFVLDDDLNGELDLIDFKRIKGGKPFNTELDWYQSMLTEIGQTKG